MDRSSTATYGRGCRAAAVVSPVESCGLWLSEIDWELQVADWGARAGCRLARSSRGSATAFAVATATCAHSSQLGSAYARLEKKPLAGLPDPRPAVLRLNFQARFSRGNGSRSPAPSHQPAAHPQARRRKRMAQVRGTRTPVALTTHGFEVRARDLPRSLLQLPVPAAPAILPSPGGAH
jgi:hypothetical protein